MFRLNAPVFALMTTEAFSQNVGKLFSELKLVTDNLSIHAKDDLNLVLVRNMWLTCQFVAIPHVYSKQCSR